jgi:hypothetical protein
VIKIDFLPYKMPVEYEKMLFGYDKKLLRKTLEENGFEKKGLYIFKVLNFKTDGTNFRSIRLRDEGYRISFTTKIRDKSGYDIENEVYVSDF